MPNGVEDNYLNHFRKESACEYLTLDFKKNYILFVSSNNISRSKRHNFKN